MTLLFRNCSHAEMRDERQVRVKGAEAFLAFLCKKGFVGRGDVSTVVSFLTLPLCLRDYGLATGSIHHPGSC